MCQWFAGCENEAEGIVGHPTLYYVPCCRKCAARASRPFVEGDFIRDDPDSELLYFEPDDPALGGSGHK